VGAFSNELLTLWIGADYASHAAPVLQILAVGTLLGAADGIVATLLDAIGLPRVNAKFSICELVLYVGALFGALHVFGFVGAAVATVLRAAIDFHARLWLAGKFYPAVNTVARRVTLATFTGTVLLLAPNACAGFAERCMAAGGATILFWSILYAGSATTEERLLVRSKVGALVSAVRFRLGAWPAAVVVAPPTPALPTRAREKKTPCQPHDGGPALRMDAGGRL